MVLDPSRLIGKDFPGEEVQLYGARQPSSMRLECRAWHRKKKKKPPFGSSRAALRLRTGRRRCCRHKRRWSRGTTIFILQSGDQRGADPARCSASRDTFIPFRRCAEIISRFAVTDVFDTRARAKGAVIVARTQTVRSVDSHAAVYQHMDVLCTGRRWLNFSPR